MKKNLLKIISFVLIFSLLLVGYSELIRDKESTLDDFYDLPKNSIDVFTVGSSHAYSGYIPAVLWKEYGISSYNLYAWAMPMWTAYHYVKEGLKTQSPSVVCLDISSIWYGAGYDTAQLDEIDYEHNQALAFGLNRYGLVLSSLFVGSTRHTLGEINDVTRYHNRWRMLFDKTSSGIASPDYAFLRNYGALFTELDYPLMNMSFYQDMLAPRKDVQTYLNKLYDLSIKENFDLVFVLTPCEMTKEAAFVVNWIREYARLNNIDFLDFMDSSVYDFDLQYDMADVDHLNYHGAFKATRYLGNYLISNYTFSDPGDNADFESISRDSRAVYKMIDMSEVFLGDSDVNAIYDWITTSDNQRIMITVSNPSRLTDLDLAFLNSLGIDTTEHTVSILSNGTVDSSEPLNENNRILFPDMVIDIATDENGSTLLVKDGYTLNSSNSPISIFIYDYDLQRSCYIVNIEGANYNVSELVQLLRGAG